MPNFDLNQTAVAEIHHQTTQYRTIVACLCAEWCDVCKIYRPKFEELAHLHPEALFLWIDVEDQAALVGDFEIDNFPTVLIQQEDVVTFFGTMQPETAQLHRILQSQQTQQLDELRQYANSGEQQRAWQVEANLRARMSQHTLF